MKVELKRLEARQNCGVRKPSPEGRFDRLTHVAAALFQAPIALIYLVDEHRQWLESHRGIEPRQTMCLQAFCARALHLGPDEVRVVADITLAPLFADDPVVVDGPKIRFYMGAALTARGGENLGTLCVIDTKPRPWPSDDELSQLRSLAQTVVDEIEFSNAKRALDDQTRILKLAEAMSGVGNWRYDLLNSKVTWSDEVYRIHGLDRAIFDPSYGGAVSFYHPDDQDVLKALVERAVDEGTGYSCQLRITRADGKLRHVLARAECELGSDGETIAIAGVFQDITDQIHVVSAAKRNEAHYRLLADNVGDVITRIRLDGSSDYISPSVEQLLGLTPLEMAGKPAQAFVHPDDQPTILAVFEELARGLQQKTVCHRAVRKNGETVWVETNFRLVRDPRGDPTEIVAVIRDITDRKALELEAATAREHAEDKARRAAVAERIAGLGHWRVTFPDQTLTWSEQMYVIYGLEAGSPINVDAVMAMTHPEDRKVTQDQLDSDLRGEGLETRPVIRIIRPCGEIRFVMGDTRVERDPSGQAQALVGTLTDITERREVERVLIESEERYRLLAENLTDMIVTSDLAGRIIYASPSCETVMGYSPEELGTIRAIDRTHPDDIKRVQRVFSELAAGAGPERFRWRAKHKVTGEWIWLESKPGLLRDPVTGAPTGFLDVIRDASEQHRAETEVALSEARYRLLAENATDMIVTSSLEGRTLYVSPATIKLTGYSLEEATGIRTLDLVHPDDGGRMITAFRALMAGKTPERVRWRGRHKLRGWTWFESLPALVTDPSTGAPAGFVDVVRDVTAQVAQEEELKVAKAAAEAATAVKTEFLANMSHELRTPLTSILGFAELLRRHVDASEEGARYLKRVTGASEALLSIVNDILDFSKLEAGQVEIDRRAVSPAAIVDAAVQLVAPQAEAKGLSLLFEPSETLPPRVMLDDARVRQVLLNLTSNAIKFTAEGRVIVRLSHAQEVLRCEIIDTGQGIPSDRLDRLFRRFSQIDGSTTRSHGGTGLGLAICKGLVEAMGGQIGADSREEEGSTFWFELPCKAIADNELTKSAPEALIGDAGALSGLRVLVADDNPINRELIRILLTPAEVEVTLVSSGEAAIAAATETPFDIILMEIHMPGLGGALSAERIRQNRGPNDSTPILALAVDADAGKTPADWGVAFDGHLRQPIAPAELFWMLRHWAPGGAGADLAERLYV